MAQIELQQLAEQLLLQVKMGNPTLALEDSLASWQLDLARSLSSDAEKKAFWINVYNAYFQILATHDQVNKPAIYRAPLIQIAGQKFSLDEIEHGILRRYRYKPALGFLPDLFAPRRIKNLAVKKIDFRIHFALNCGAVSCPPIAFYDAQKIDTQLDLATRSFLEAETVILEEKREIQVSRLMLWYMGDFGGYRGIKKMLRKYLSVDTTSKRIIFRAYDWTERLGDFLE